MTDRNTPTLDPVEDRIRRTFAVRAEDMAPGDSAGAMPDLGRGGRAAPRRFRGTRRPMMAAAVVVVVAAAGVALVARDGDRDAGRLSTAAEQPPPGETERPAVTAPRPLVDALQDERQLAVAILLGIDGALALPVTDTAEARTDTDAAVATFGAFVASAPDGAAYRRSLEGLGALDALRRDVDSDAGPRSLDNVDAAQEVFDRYAAIVGGLLDDQLAHAESIADPDARTVAVAYARGLRLGEQTTQLIQVSVLSVVLPGSESVAELVRLRAAVEQGLDTLVTDTAGTPLADAAVAVVGEVEEAGLLEAAGGAVDGTGDVSVLVGAIDLLQDHGWPAFLDRVEEVLAAQS